MVIMRVVAICPKCLAPNNMSKTAHVAAMYNYCIPVPPTWGGVQSGHLFS